MKIEIQPDGIWYHGSDKPTAVGVDIHQHPRTTMDKNAEFLTKRPLKVKMISEL